MFAVCDFETRSHSDIRKVSAWNYSKHPTTEILCFSVWDSVSKCVRTWRYNQFENPPEWFVELYKKADLWVAHNAFFEIVIWQHVLQKDFPSFECPSLDKWIDSKAIALNWALPASLDGCTQVVGGRPKDKEGSKLMLKMCKPRKKQGRYYYYWTKADYERLIQYCEQDVLATVDLILELGPLQKMEQPVFELDKRINHKGFKIDRELALAGFKIAEQLNAEACAELDELTNGLITTPNQHARFKQFAKMHGVVLESTDKAAVVELLKRDDLPDAIRRVFEIRQALGKSSVAKYAKCLALMDKEDHRVRDSLVYHKASTGRWAGQGFQPQNLPSRGVYVEDIERAVEAVKNWDVEYLKTLGNPMNVLSTLIRSTIVSDKGKKFVAADFSGVETRGTLWLAGETEAVEMLRNGGDLYIDVAAEIFGIDPSEVTKIQRDRYGKPTVLGFTYGMSGKRFSATTGIPIHEADRIIKVARSKYSKVPRMWRALEKAFRGAVIHKGRRIDTEFGVSFYVGGRVLKCVLPSGRELKYWDPRLRTDGSITYWTVGIGGKWIRVDTWGGKIVENVIQALCSDLLRFSMLNLDRAGWNLCMTVHDEAVCEMLDDPKYTVDKMIEIMVQLPKWAYRDKVGWFPLAAEGWEGYRFRK